MKRRITFVLMLVAVVARAAEPPALNYFAQIPSRSPTRPPKIEISLGKVPIELEKTTLGEVVAKASAGDIKHAGDAGDSTYWVCYSANQGATPFTVWLLSGEMGGLNHTILEVRAVSSARSHSEGDCPALPATMRPVVLLGGISIGAPSSVLPRILDAPGADASGWHGYRYTLKIPGNTCSGGWDRGGAVAAQVDDGVVVAMAAEQVTSC